jgi:Subtilase family
MAESQRRLILANGENLVGVIPKPGGGGPTPLPRTYDEARERVVSQLTASLGKAISLPPTQKYPDEMVLCLRLHPDMLAKSYDPASIFIEVPELRNVGSRNWTTKSADVAQTERIKKQRQKGASQTLGRLLFVQGGEAGFRRLLRTLDLSPRVLRKQFMEDIQKIESFDLLTPKERILGFDSNWQKGRVELALHPTQNGSELQRDFFGMLFKQLEISKSQIRSAFYGDGSAFASVFITREALKQLGDCNPLRTAHPLLFSEPVDLRSVSMLNAPAPPNSTTVSTIKLGIFDGGIDENSPLLKGHAQEDIALSIKTPRDPKYVAHGTAVAGAALYGPLDRHDPNKPLPPPPISVVSIRTLPLSNPGDWDLYEAIDIIEAAVPVRTDIKVFNISFGPKGQILDDNISRFTHALDSLALTHKITFCIAVGNDGDLPESRIQSPADAVHSLGIGAYTVRGGKHIRAPYSCKGPGREGSKIKPDVSAFGGCTISPIHLVSTVAGKKALAQGTSFASPIAGSICAQAHGYYDRATALLTRCLVTHTAIHPDGDPDHELGHGCIVAHVDEVLRAPLNAATIAYQGQLSPKSFYKLVIPLPEKIVLPGNVEIIWTIAALCPTERAHPGDYTACCIEDTFYPNSHAFNFAYEPQKPGEKKRSKHLHLRHDKAEISALGAGWSKPQFPASKSGNRYPTEHDKRSMEYKWDTIVRHRVSMRGDSIEAPFIVLHALSRHGHVNRFDYAATVTICAPKFQGDLFSEIVTRYPVLQPIRVRTEAEIRVKI